MASHQEIDQETINQIAGYMRVGADYFLATAAVGITEEVAQEWLNFANEAKSKGENNIYKILYESIRCSSAHAEVIALQRLSAEGGSAGAKWLLEKLNPQKYNVNKNKSSNSHGNAEVVFGAVSSAEDLLKNG